jgi:hypothetical protein
MPRLTLKRSTIFISTGDKIRVFRSMGEVPPGLRKKLEQSTNGINARTILIADRKGREEMVRAIRGLPSEKSAEPADATEERPPVRGWRFRTLLRNWAEILLPIAILLIVWLLFSTR